MKLTKDQRFTAYCIMLAEAEKVRFNDSGDCTTSTYWGFCELLVHGMGRVIGLNDLPELYAKKPKRYAGMISFWFPHDKRGWGERKKLLEECIEETAID